MATNIKNDYKKVFVGSGAPADGDLLTNPTFYPVGSIYVDKDSGTSYVRNAVTKVAADWAANSSSSGDSGEAMLEADVTYYIDTTGSDTTGDGSIGAPFATIAHALSLVPKNLNGHQAYISVNDGTYTLDSELLVDGFYGAKEGGSGELYIASTSQDSSLVILTGSPIRVCANAVFIYIEYVTLPSVNPYSTWITGNSAPVSLDGVKGPIGYNTVRVLSSTVSLWISDHLRIKMLEGAFIQETNGNTDIIYEYLGGIWAKQADGFIRTPETAPTDDYQVANKKYVDDAIAAALNP